MALGRERSAGSSESEVSAALQALGYTATEAREAARGAVASLPVGSSLEDRVKAALRVRATEGSEADEWKA